MSTTIRQIPPDAADRFSTRCGDISISHDPAVEKALGALPGVHIEQRDPANGRTDCIYVTANQLPALIQYLTQIKDKEWGTVGVGDIVTPTQDGKSGFAVGTRWKIMAKTMGHGDEFVGNMRDYYVLAELAGDSLTVFELDHYRDPNTIIYSEADFYQDFELVD